MLLRMVDLLPLFSFSLGQPPLAPPQGGELAIIIRGHPAPRQHTHAALA